MSNSPPGCMHCTEEGYHVKDARASKGAVPSLPDIFGHFGAMYICTRLLLPSAYILSSRPSPSPLSLSSCFLGPAHRNYLLGFTRTHLRAVGAHYSALPWPP